MKNNFETGIANLFPNHATFGNVLDELPALARYRAQGHQLTLLDLWVKCSDAYMMVNW